AAEKGPGPIAEGAPVALTLDDCLREAMARQPALAAHRASLAAAEENRIALATILIPAVIARELPTRRCQAALGVRAAAAGLAQAECETRNAVIRCYFTVQYARAQEQVALDVVDRLKAIHDTVKRMVDAGARDVTAAEMDRTSVYLDLAETRRIQAAKGSER